MGKKRKQSRGEGLRPVAKLAFISDLGMKQNLLLSMPLYYLQSFMNSTEHVLYIVSSFPMIPD